jgi:hypothetical protein
MRLVSPVSDKNEVRRLAEELLNSLS